MLAFNWSREWKRLPTWLATLVVSLLTFGCLGPSLFQPAALSWGGPSSGGQSFAAEFPNRGPGFVRSRPGEETAFGMSRLILSIQNAGTSVHTAFGGTLRVGDIAYRTGGRHPRHHSHQSGRDIDVSFYVVDASGRPTTPGALGFSHVGEQRDEGAVYHFDVMRNWFFVRALLSDPAIDLQWIFCSHGVKAQLLDYALSIETETSLLVRAAHILHQPSTGNPHDDHFHIRVFCSPTELDSGCIDSEPIWPWVRRALASERPSGERSDEEVIELLMQDPFF